ncbi:MAG: DUF2155 domain-containing protein [bacterium]
MKRRLMAVALVFALVLAFGACKKKAQEQAQPQGGAGAPGIMMPKGEIKIEVPANVKNKWNAVVLSIEDKAKNKAQDVTVNLGSEYVVPNTNIKVKVGDYLPDFRMDGLTITSSSDQPNNPAVNIKVFEGDKEIFKGWLYSKFPSIHPFQHEKIGLTLKEAVKKG